MELCSFLDPLLIFLFVADCPRAGKTDTFTHLATHAHTHRSRPFRPLARDASDRLQGLGIARCVKDGWEYCQPEEHCKFSRMGRRGRLHESVADLYHYS